MESTHQYARRRLLKSILSGFGLFLIGRGVRICADDRFSKKTMGYRERPDGHKKCADCSHFLPGKNLQAPGRCAVVEGEINPNGWCTVWATRRPIEGC